jgi:hypothetical protein
VSPIQLRQHLLPKEVADTLPPLYSTEKTPDPLVVVKFFVPWNNWTFYATEGSEEEGDWRFFGLVDGHEKELGYFVLSELESIRGPGGLTIERDLHFKQEPLSKFR